MFKFFKKLFNKRKQNRIRNKIRKGRWKELFAYDCLYCKYSDNCGLCRTALLNYVGCDFSDEEFETLFELFMQYKRRQQEFDDLDRQQAIDDEVSYE